MNATVLFVDDDQRMIRVYADAIEARGLDTRCLHTVDDTLAYLRAAENEAAVIVWDMMMAPGEAFGRMDTDGGLSTGRFLFPEMRRLRPRAAFILLTNQQAEHSAADCPAERSFVRFKAETPPDELADLISHLLQSQTA